MVVLLHCIDLMNLIVGANFDKKFAVIELGLIEGYSYWEYLNSKMRNTISITCKITSSFFLSGFNHLEYLRNISAKSFTTLKQQQNPADKFSSLWDPDIWRSNRFPLFGSLLKSRGKENLPKNQHCELAILLPHDVSLNNW